MAQINLLKQTSSSSNFFESGPKLLVRVFVVVLLVLAAYYVWLFIDLKSTNKQISDAQTKINSDSQAALTIAGRDEALTRQLQAKSLQGLIAGHLYWSQFFKPLADVTLNTASYSSLRVSTAGEVDLSVSVPTLDDMDKYMQVFNQPEFNNNFYNVRISGYSKIQNKDTTSIQFSVRMQYSPSIIQYKAASPTSN